MDAQMYIFTGQMCRNKVSSPQLKKDEAELVAWRGVFIWAGISLFLLLLFNARLLVVLQVRQYPA